MNDAVLGQLWSLPECVWWRRGGDPYLGLAAALHGAGDGDTMVFPAAGHLTCRPASVTPRSTPAKDQSAGDISLPSHSTVAY